MPGRGEIELPDNCSEDDRRQRKLDGQGNKATHQSPRHELLPSLANTSRSIRSLEVVVYCHIANRLWACSQRGERRARNRRGLRIEGVLELHRHRAPGSSRSAMRRTGAFKYEECLLGGKRRDFAGDAAQLPARIGDDQVSGLLRPRQEVSSSSGRMERRSITSASTPCAKLFGGMQRLRDHERRADDREVRPARTTFALPIGVARKPSATSPPLHRASGARG